VEKIFHMPNEQLIQKWAQIDIKYAEMLKEKNIAGEITLPNFLGHEFTVSNMDFL